MQIAPQAQGFIMSKNNAENSNLNQQQLSKALRQLAEHTAINQAEIMSASAKHEFQAMLEYYTKIKAKEYAEKTYNDLLKQAEQTIGNIAENASNRAIQIESETATPIANLSLPQPKFASFDRLLEDKRSQYNKMALLSDQKTLTDVEQNVQHTLSGWEEDEDDLEIDNDSNSQRKESIDKPEINASVISELV